MCLICAHTKKANRREEQLVFTNSSRGTIIYEGVVEKSQMCLICTHMITRSWANNERNSCFVPNRRGEQSFYEGVRAVVGGLRRVLGSAISLCLLYICIYIYLYIYICIYICITYIYCVLGVCVCVCVYVCVCVSVRLCVCVLRDIPCTLCRKQSVLRVCIKGHSVFRVCVKGHNVFECVLRDILCSGCVLRDTVC